MQCGGCEDAVNEALTHFLMHFFGMKKESLSLGIIILLVNKFMGVIHIYLDNIDIFH